jgi:hypothetical protein
LSTSVLEYVNRNHHSCWIANMEATALHHSKELVDLKSS